MLAIDELINFGVRESVRLRIFSVPCGGMAHFFAPRVRFGCQGFQSRVAIVISELRPGGPTSLKRARMFVRPPDEGSPSSQTTD